MFNQRSKFMERLTIFTLCLISALAIAAPAVDGQTNAPVAKNSSNGTANGKSHVTSTRPNAPAARNVARAPRSVGPRMAYSRPTQTGAQRAVNLRPNYSAPARRLSPTLAAMSARQSARIYNVQPVAEPLAKNDVVQPALPPLTKSERILRPYDSQPARNIPTRENVARATRDVPTGGKIVQSPSDELAPRETSQSKRRHNWHGNKDHLSYRDASRRHRQWRDRNWWKKNCETIVFVNSGYYFLDAGYWYPAFGYDPLNSYYDYDGPIYTYGNLLPDQVIANVQEALQDAGYYFGPVTGSLSVETRAALANFQRDYGLIITGAIDEPTVSALGLY
jgi:hypothetical protein